MPRRYATAGALMLTLALPSFGGAQDWQDARATVPAHGRVETVRQNAVQTALARALAEFLQNWLSRDDIAREESLLNRWFFTHPDDYVAAMTDVAQQTVANRMLWSAKVRFDPVAVAAKLKAVGLIQPWDRDPTFAVMWTGDDFPAEITGSAWVRALNNAGIRLRWRQAGAAALAGEDVDGQWTVSVERHAVPHPLDADRSLSATDVAIIGDVRGRPFAAHLAMQPHELSPPSDMQILQFVERVLTLWAPDQQQRMDDLLWTAGDFRFADIAGWMAFDRALLDERAVFHLVHPRSFTRDRDGYRVRYAFYLNPGEEATAEAWFLNRDRPVKRSGERQFTVAAP